MTAKWPECLKRKNEGPPLSGFPCLSCGGRTRCNRARTPETGLVVRYRQCQACGVRVITEERLSTTRKTRADRPQTDKEAAEGSKA